MNSSNQTLHILVIIVLVLTGCSALDQERPDHYGTYLQENDDLVELEQVLGSNNLGDLEGIPGTSQTRPTLILFGPQFNYHLIFYNHTVDTRVAFDTEAGGAKILEITPEDDLESGVYCLTLGNITLTVMKMPSWCFSVNIED